MLSRKFLLTFDWVVNRLVSFNQAHGKDKSTRQKLRYVFKLAALRGCKHSIYLFNCLCQKTLTISQIRKVAKKLSTFVSPEEVKVLLAPA
ncbi:hypothetical protein [Facilibium subflavum]|uniref:hypothetical protein n=1 Tax=Facilibium subflavum TaxID=2219058 RepID=UPI000E6507C3|nr:hypothetical protein [Facilibium subflavum]